MAGDLCRVTLIAPRVRLDVALPSTVPLASLLPTLLWHSGERLAEEGVPQGGWAVQRAGDAPLDTAASLARLGIRDGDILHLRPHLEAMPEPVYDDAVDAIATALREHARRWSPAHTRAAALACAGVLLLAGAVVLAGAGLARLVLAEVAGAAALLALAGAAAASRAFGDGTSATVLGIGALPYAYLAGLHAMSPRPGDLRFLAGAAAVLMIAAAAVAAAGADVIIPDGGVAAGGGAGVTGGPGAGVAVGAGAGAGGGVAVGVGAGAGHPAAALLGAVAVASIAAGCAALAVFTSGAGAAAAAVTIALGVFPVIAPLAYRMAGLPRPEVAARADELRQRGQTVDAADVTRRGLAADRIVAALLAASGALVIGGAVIMLRGGGWGAEVLAGVAAVLLALRVRLFAGVVQRATLIGSALVVVIGLAVLAGPRLHALGSLAALGVLAAAVAAACAVAAAPERRRSLSLARAGDLAELLLTIATVPLALQVLHVFSLIRSLHG